MHSKRVGGAITLKMALVAIAVTWLSAASANAGTSPKLTVLSEKGDPAGDTRQFVVHSALVGHDFVVAVSTPPIFGSWVSADLKAAGAKQAEQKLPAIYALDAGYGVAGPIMQMLAGTGTVSPAYVVTVGYRASESGWHNTDLLYRSVTENGMTFGGGGARFEAFLTQELRPFLEAKYPLDPTKAILFGHSFGGLFAANVLAASPEAFDGYVIASPSVWEDPQVMPELAGLAKTSPRRVFVAVGDQEDAKMRDGTSQLVATLSAAPSGFKVESKVFAGEGHISYYPLLTQAAFTWLMPPPGSGTTAISLPLEALRRVAGVYELADGRVITVTLKAAKTFIQVTGMPGESELLPESAQRFFLPGGYASMTFEGAMDAPASSVTVSMNGTQLHASRKAQ